MSSQFLVSKSRQKHTQTLLHQIGMVVGGRGFLPSLVMKDMNSLTHSCMHSLASLAIFALSGRAFFMIRATGAKLRMLASTSSYLSAFWGRDGPGHGLDES